MPAADPTAAAATRDDSGGPGLSWRQVLETATVVVAPASLVTGLLFYLGWAHTEHVLGHFGLNASVVASPTSDYIVRSIDALFKPLASFAALGVVAVWAHVSVRRWLMVEGRKRLLGQVTAGTVAVGAVVLGIGMVGMFQSRRGLAWSLSLSVGALLLAYGAMLARRFGELDDRDRAVPWKRSVVVAYGLLLFTLVALGLFWSAVNYAAAVGAERARRLEAGIPALGDVVLYSSGYLGLSGPGIGSSACTADDAVYRHRTDGLKLLLRSDDKYFLLPAGWSPQSGSVIVLPDNEDIRVEFSAGGFSDSVTDC